MKSIEALLENFWIIKSLDKDFYFQVRSDMSSIERFARDYPGWKVICNERIIKLEKLPAHAESFMGIEAFKSKLDYAVFCSLLIFLEDKEEYEAFLLSEVVDNIEIQLKDFVKVDWTLFSDRKALIRVMQYAVDIGLLLCHEGDISVFSGGIGEEVLYENTGLSRYFAVNFPVDISGCKSCGDFENLTADIDSDRGQARVNRVYRRLISCPAMYWETNDDADSVYLKNKRSYVSGYLHEYLGGRLDVHRNSAYLMLEDNDDFGEVFPKDSTICDISVLMCSLIRQHGELMHKDDGTVDISYDVFSDILHECIEEYSFAWSREFREMTQEKLLPQLLRFMESWMLIRLSEDKIVIIPGAYKFMGVYPKSVMNDKYSDEAAREESSGGESSEQLSLF